MTRELEVESAVEHVVSVAARTPWVLAVALVGSRAVRRARPDSDLDLIVVVEHRRAVEQWQVLAPGGRLIREQRWGALSERRLVLQSGLELELGFVEPSWASVAPVDEGTRSVVVDGLRVLHDPHGLLQKLLEAIDDAPALKAALGLLAARDKSTAQLTERLERKGFAAEVIRQTVNRVATLGYLDDRLLARRKSEALLADGWAGAALLEKLIAAGLPEGLAEEERNRAIAAVGWSERTAAEGLVRSRGLREVKGARFLLARGFDEDTVRAVLQLGSNES